MTNIGQIDAVYHWDDTTVIAKLKYHAKRTIDGLLDDAMKQIHECRYCEPYTDRKILLLAVAFAGKEADCRLEKLDY
jgi:hypothetical protein